MKACRHRCFQGVQLWFELLFSWAVEEKFELFMQGINFGYRLELREGNRRATKRCRATIP